MENSILIPHLFRSEYRKIAAVLYRQFGFAHIEIAEDIASDTFLAASETWGLRGLPENPVAWLYTVAKNKAKNYVKHLAVRQQKMLERPEQLANGPDIDLSEEHIYESQLQMMFAVCHPSISAESQIGLALQILCGFGVGEIAQAFLTNNETIQKRLKRAREKLKIENIRIELPGASEMDARLDAVLTTLYLLFSEGYHSNVNNMQVRKELCLEAMNLTYLLLGNSVTNKSVVKALFSLMCFQASRLEARTGGNGEMVLYDDQDPNRWDKDLIEEGEYFLNLACQGNEVSKYHLEAGIAYWHTIKDDSVEKWESILQLYNQLLCIEYSPIAALNRQYAYFKARGAAAALAETEKLQLEGNHFYHTLLGELYRSIDPDKARSAYLQAFALAKHKNDQDIIMQKLNSLSAAAQSL